MNIKKILGLPLYLKLKETKIKNKSLIVYPAYDFTLYFVLKNIDNFALVMDENFKIQFISTQKYINVDYKFNLNMNMVLKNELENPDINLSEDFFNYFQNLIEKQNNVSICLYEKFTKDSFVLVKNQDETKGYWVDTDIKIYICNTKTKFKETIDSNDVRTLYSHFGVFKNISKSKKIYLSMKRVFYVKKDVEVLTSEVEF